MNLHHHNAHVDICNKFISGTALVDMCNNHTTTLLCNNHTRELYMQLCLTIALHFVISNNCTIILYMQIHVIIAPSYCTCRYTAPLHCTGQICVITLPLLITLNMLDLCNLCTNSDPVLFYFCFTFASLNFLKLVNIRLFQSYLQPRAKSVVTFSLRNDNVQFYNIV